MFFVHSNNIFITYGPFYGIRIIFLLHAVPVLLIRKNRGRFRVPVPTDMQSAKRKIVLHSVICSALPSRSVLRGEMIFVLYSVPVPHAVPSVNTASVSSVVVFIVVLAKRPVLFVFSFVYDVFRAVLTVFCIRSF